MKDKLSYSLGVSVGSNLAHQGFNLEQVDEFIVGLKDALERKPLQISEEEVNKTIEEHFKNIQKNEIKKNQQMQKDFFENNLKKEGVKQTESGLQYEVIKSGDGKASPTQNDRVLAHYHGMFLDGKVFDSSVERGEPITLPVNGVIQGWQEALQMMTVGDKWKLYIPSELAYGAQGAGNAIPPHTPLMFEVELLEIK